jgi:hypothetical protein
VTEWWEQRQDEDVAAARQRREERVAAGLPIYTVDPDPAKRFQFLSVPPPGRRALVRAYARAAELCRNLPGSRRELYRRLMRQALDRAEASLLNQYAAKKRRWIAEGCPRDLPPWSVISQRAPREVTR